eukprot:898671-Prorocentrum_lima.AAC.1
MWPCGREVGSSRGDIARVQMLSFPATSTLPSRWCCAAGAGAGKTLHNKWVARRVEAGPGPTMAALR